MPRLWGTGLEPARSGHAHPPGSSTLRPLPPSRLQHAVAIRSSRITRCFQHQQTLRSLLSLLRPFRLHLKTIAPTVLSCSSSSRSPALLPSCLAFLSTPNPGSLCLHSVLSVGPRFRGKAGRWSDRHRPAGLGPILATCQSSCFLSDLSPFTTRLFQPF